MCDSGGAPNYRNMALQGIAQSDSIEPWAEIPSLTISCGYGHSKTLVDKTKFEQKTQNMQLEIYSCASLAYQEIHGLETHGD